MFPSRAREEACRFIADAVRGWASLNVLELGTLRSPHSAESDGHSTLFFRSLIAQVGRGLLVSVDKDLACSEVAAAVLVNNGFSLSETVFVCGDAETFLEAFIPARVNLLYLDGLDYLDKPASEDWHLRCFALARMSLPPGALVVVDDNFNRETFEGKGRLVYEQATALGYKLLHNSYQIVLEKDTKSCH